MKARREDYRRWAEANPDALKEQRHRTREKHSEQRREYNRWYREAHPEAGREKARRYREAHPDKARDAIREYREALRVAVFEHYGHVCACPGCGATERLSVDHVNRDGSQHRSELFGRAGGGGQWVQMYAWLVNNNFPEGFQMLCRPCNSSKSIGPRCRIDHTGVNACKAG